MGKVARKVKAAGGVLWREVDGEVRVAVVHRPRYDDWSLPKGKLDPGEGWEEAAVREVEEETGLAGRLVEKLGDVRYVYTWAGERIFKVVTFHLFRYRGGRLGDIAAEQRHEVAETCWLPLGDAPRLLAYGGERAMAEKALASLEKDTL